MINSNFFYLLTFRLIVVIIGMEIPRDDDLILVTLKGEEKKSRHIISKL